MKVLPALLLVAALPCVGAEVSIPGDAALTLKIPATVSKPDGPGPFAAVVVLHDCSGLGPRSSGAPRRWADLLVNKGYVTILPDSFTSRGHPDGICTVPPLQRRAGVTPVSRAGDAYAALAYLRSLPYVDGNRVAVMGGWHDDLTGDYAPLASVYILIGERDDWTPAENCRRLVDAARKAGHPVSIRVYPGAHHAFDNNGPERYVASRVNANAPGKRGATTGGQPAAWADSIREVDLFFGRYMGKPRE